MQVPMERKGPDSKGRQIWVAHADHLSMIHLDLRRFLDLDRKDLDVIAFTFPIMRHLQGRRQGFRVATQLDFFL
jgi:hypothetical protein